jgi:hypothetical protein
MELGEDHVLTGTARTPQYAKDFHLHGLGPGAGKNRPGRSHLAAMYLAEGVKAAAGGRGGGGRRGGGLRWEERREQGGKQGGGNRSGQGSEGVRDCLEAGIHVYKIKPVLHCSGRLRFTFVCHALRF